MYLLQNTCAAMGVMQVTLGQGLGWFNGFICKKVKQCHYKWSYK